MNKDELKEKIQSLEDRLAKIEHFLKPQMHVQEELEASTQKAMKLLAKYDLISVHLLQRTLSVGFARAARVLDLLEEKGYISASEGVGKPRKVLKKV